MTLQEIANALVASCRADTAANTLEDLYAADAISVEAMDNGNGRQMQGIAAIRGKHEWWRATFDVFESDVSDPMLHPEDRFAVIFRLKAKHKESGETSDMKEIGLYTVSNGKIIREEFFYPIG